jgi:hypothetical protein
MTLKSAVACVKATSRSSTARPQEKTEMLFHRRHCGKATKKSQAVIPGRCQRVGALAPPDDRLRIEPGISRFPDAQLLI